MSSLQELVDIGELAKVWEVSNDKPVLLFKQSTTCPISSKAFEQFQAFLRDNEHDIHACFVKVRESRPVSNEIAEKLDVRHQSPQIFFVRNGKSLWDASHMQITIASINEALKAYSA